MEDGGPGRYPTDDLFHARELEKSQAVDELSGINRMSRQNWHNRRSLTPIDTKFLQLIGPFG
jgi:hypothetical protein